MSSTLVSTRLRAPVGLLAVGALLLASTAGNARPAVAGTKVTFKGMHWNSLQTDQSKWWTDLIHGFTALHPEATIENEYVPFGQYLTSLESQAAANTLPDVFYAHVKAGELGRSGHTIDFKAALPASFL